MELSKKGMLPAINITVNVSSNDISEAIQKKPIDKDKLIKVNEEILKMMKKEKEPVFTRGNAETKAENFIK